MHCFRAFTILFCIVCLPGPVVPGQGRVVEIASQGKDLKRTARRLRIGVEQLKNARDALQEATDLARHSLEPSVFSQLPQGWIRLNRAKSPSVLEDLFGWLRVSVRNAPDAQAYQRGSSAARSLLSSLATLDSERAAALWRQWPDPPASLGDSAREIKEQIDKQFAEQLLMQSGGGNAEEALAMMKEQASRRLDYSRNARLAAQLNQSGKKAEALRMVDQSIAAFQQQNADPRSISSYLGFVRCVRRNWRKPQ